jgi:RimJ/RimL family protein N-acetyltransferase
MKLVEVDPDNAEHLRELYELLGERNPNECISHKQMPTFAEHVDFVSSKPYLAWYLIQEDELYLGAVYLSRQREIGIFLFPGFQGMDYGKMAVAELMVRHPGRFLANISPENYRSQKFFEKLGFTLIQQTYARE